MEFVSIKEKTTEKTSQVQTKLTDVNIDCLEEIFKYLELKELLNIADASQRLRKAASFIFASTYQPKIHIEDSKQHDQYVWGVRYYRNCNSKTESENMGNPNKGQKLDTLKTCFQLIRCFGSRIEFIKMEKLYGEPAERLESFDESYITSYKQLLFNINYYCSEWLKEIVIFDCPPGALNQLKKPFLRVDTVKTSVCVLKTNLWNILFPKLRTLQYGYHDGRELNGIEVAKCFPLFGIDNKFPHLERLTVHEKRIFIECREALHNQLCIALRLNPQIRALHLAFVADLNIIKVVRDNLSSIEELTLRMDKRIVPFLQHERIHFGSVKIFHFYNSCVLEQYSDGVIQIHYLVKFTSEYEFPFTFDHLEKLFFWNSCFASTEAFYKCMKQNPSIVELGISSAEMESIVKPSELTKMLPLLADLVIPDDWPSNEMLNDYINQIKTLRSLSLLVYRPINVDNLESYFGRKIKLFKSSTPIGIPPNGLYKCIMENLNA